MASQRSKEFNKLIREAAWMWSGGAYQFRKNLAERIRRTPVVRFRNRKNINTFRNILNITGLSRPGFYNRDAIVPNRNYYIIHANNRDPIYNFKPRILMSRDPSTRYGHIGLANKANVNRLVHERSLRNLEKNLKARGAKQIIAAGKVSQILMNSIKRRRQAYSNLENAILAKLAKKRWEEHIKTPITANQHAAIKKMYPNTRRRVSPI